MDAIAEGFKQFVTMILDTIKAIMDMVKDLVAEGRANK